MRMPCRVILILNQSFEDGSNNGTGHIPTSTILKDLGRQTRSQELRLRGPWLLHLFGGKARYPGSLVIIHTWASSRFPKFPSFNA